MTIQLELSEKVERRLAQDAEARGMEPSAYMASVLEKAARPADDDTRGLFTPKTLAAFLKAMAAARSRSKPAH